MADKKEFTLEDILEEQRMQREGVSAETPAEEPEQQAGESRPAASPDLSDTDRKSVV